MLKIRDALAIIRFKLSFPLSLVTLIGPLVYGFEYPLTVFLVWLGSFATVVSGCLLNDYYDYDNDLLNPKKRHKPLMRGVIKRKTVLNLGNFFNILGLVILVTVTANNIIALVIASLSCCLPRLYAKFKLVPPMDLFIDSLLICFPASIGFAIYGVFPVYFIASLFFLGLMIYMHGAIYDEDVDEASSVKIFREIHPLLPDGMLLIFTLAAVGFMPFITNAVLLLLYDCVFYYTLKNRKWRMYTYATLVFPGLFLLRCLLHLYGIDIILNGIII